MRPDSDIVNAIGDICTINNYQLLKRLIEESDEGFVNLAKELDCDIGEKKVNLSQLTKPNRTAFNLKRNNREFDVKVASQFWKVTLWVTDQESCRSTENGQSSENVASYDGQQPTPDGTLVFGDTPLSKACGESGGSGPLLVRPTAGGPHRLPAQDPGEVSPGRPPSGRPPTGRPLDGRPPPSGPPPGGPDGPPPGGPDGPPPGGPGGPPPGGPGRPLPGGPQQQYNPPQGLFGLRGPLAAHPDDPQNPSPQAQAALQALQRNFTYQEARWILKHAAEPIKQYTNKQLIPSMLSDETLKNLTGSTRDQIYDFRNRYVMLQGRIFKVTPDAAALIALLKMHKDDTYRELAAIFNVSGCNSDKIFWKVMEVIFLDNILPQRWAFQNRMSLNFYFDLLATKTQQHPSEFEIYRHLCGQGQRLIVAVGDSTKFRLVKSSDHKLQRQTYLSRLHTNVATKMEIVDLDGDTILFFPLLASADPVLGDANIMVCQVELEENNQITGGLVRFVTGLPGFVICLILDKGFLVHRFNPCNRTLMQFFNTVTNNNNNRLRVFCPLNPGDTYLDNNLLPAGNDSLNLVINNVQRRRARRLTDLEANTTRVAVTMSRWIVEASYAAGLGHEHHRQKESNSISVSRESRLCSISR